MKIRKLFPAYHHSLAERRLAHEKNVPSEGPKDPTLQNTPKVDSKEFIQSFFKAGTNKDQMKNELLTSLQSEGHIDQDEYTQHSLALRQRLDQFDGMDSKNWKEIRIILQSLPVDSKSLLNFAGDHGLFTHAEISQATLNGAITGSKSSTNFSKSSIEEMNDGSQILHRMNQLKAKIKDLDVQRLQLQKMYPRGKRGPHPGFLANVGPINTEKTSAMREFEQLRSQYLAVTGQTYSEYIQGQKTERQQEIRDNNASRGFRTPTDRKGTVARNSVTGQTYTERELENARTMKRFNGMRGGSGELASDHFDRMANMRQNFGSPSGASSGEAPPSHPRYTVKQGGVSDKKRDQYKNNKAFDDSIREIETREKLRIKEVKKKEMLAKIDENIRGAENFDEEVRKMKTDPSYLEKMEGEYKGKIEKQKLESRPASKPAEKAVLPDYRGTGTPEWFHPIKVGEKQTTFANGIFTFPLPSDLPNGRYINRTGKWIPPPGIIDLQHLTLKQQKKTIERLQNPYTSSEERMKLRKEGHYKSIDDAPTMKPAPVAPYEPDTTIDYFEQEKQNPEPAPAPASEAPKPVQDDTLPPPPVPEEKPAAPTDTQPLPQPVEAPPAVPEVQEEQKAPVPPRKEKVFPIPKEKSQNDTDMEELMDSTPANTAPTPQRLDETTKEFIEDVPAVEPLPAPKKKREPEVKNEETPAPRIERGFEKEEPEKSDDEEIMDEIDKHIDEAKSNPDKPGLSPDSFDAEIFNELSTVSQIPSYVAEARKPDFLKFFKEFAAKDDSIAEWYKGDVNKIQEWKNFAKSYIKLIEKASDAESAARVEKIVLAQNRLNLPVIFESPLKKFFLERVKVLNIQLQENDRTPEVLEREYEELKSSK